MTETKRVIDVGYLARVEGEGSIRVEVENGTVGKVEFGIFEPPRLFEAFLRGRKFVDAPDITARICGICPVAYQMSSTHALEDALGVSVDGQLRELRRLLYCGEWIESHVLHVFMLHAPDFLGFQDAIQMAADHGEVVKTALKMKAIGNDILEVVGGRAVHPVNIKVGGFYRAPTKEELHPLREKLEWALAAMMDSTKLIATFPFPDLERKYDFVALHHPDEYALNEGEILSSRNGAISVAEYEQNYTEQHVERSNALQSVNKDGEPYLVGPIARFNLNYDQLSPAAKSMAEEVGLKPPVINPFKSILVRAIEIIFAFEESIRIIDQYEEPSESYVPLEPRKSSGSACTEAPRGLLYHRYDIDDDGLITEAKIVPPTAQNQLTIEDDLREFATNHLHLSDDDLTWQCEQAVRNYDPCISCATHTLKVKIDRK